MCFWPIWSLPALVLSAAPLGPRGCRGTRFRGANISVSLFRTVDKALLRGFRHSPGQERGSQQTTTRKGDCHAMVSGLLEARWRVEF